LWHDRDAIVVDVHDVGYRVVVHDPLSFVTEATATRMIYTHHVQREDSVTLFGFSTADEQFLFRRLLDVTGIGPRVALAVVGGDHPSRIVEAIQDEDLVYLTALPGIGKKTAQRIVLELKDKLPTWSTPRGVETVSPLPEVLSEHPTQEMPAAQATRSAVPTGMWREVRQALLALGFTDTEISRVRERVCAKAIATDPLESWIKHALHALHSS
jgi:Holliday junction DNA helicase RuvA